MIPEGDEFTFSFFEKGYRASFLLLSLFFFFRRCASNRDDDDDDDYDAIATVLLRRANIYHRVFEFGTESQGRRSIVHRGGYTSLRLSQKDDA